MCIPLQAFYSIRKSFTFYQASHEIWSTSGTAAPGRQKYTASAWRCATTCARRHPHLSLAELLHTHPPPRPPESHRARGPMPTFPRDWLERCPGSLPGVYPHVWSHAGCARAVGIPHAMFPQSLCVRTQPRQRPHAPSSPQGEDQPPPWTTEPQLLLGPCPAPSRFSPQGDLSSAGERDGVPPLADRTVSKKALAWVHSGWAGIWARIVIPADSPWHRGSPSLPFHSCLARGAGSFLYQNTQLERAGARKDFRLWEWISQKKPASGRQTNLEVCSYLRRQQPNTSRYWMCNVLALLSPTVRSHCWWSQHGYTQFGIMSSALCTWLEEITARSITNWNSFGVDFFFDWPVKT